MSSNEVEATSHEFRDWVKKSAARGAGMVAGVLIVISPYLIDSFTNSGDEHSGELKTLEDKRLTCGFDEQGTEILLTKDEIEAMPSPPPVCIAIRGTGFIKGIDGEASPSEIPNAFYIPTGPED